MEILPEDLVHKIMSYLPNREVIRIGVLSSRFNAIWRAFPIIEFDFDGKRHRNVDVFFRLVYQYLLGRSTNVLEKLSIRAYFNSLFNPLGPDLLFLAASYNLNELDLENSDTEVRDNQKDGRHFSIVLPGSIFHIRPLTVLKVDCFRFETPNLVLGRRSALKKLKISRSVGLHDITLNNNLSLESLEIDYCEELATVDIDATKLSYFEFLGPFSMQKCEIIISPQCRSLRTLKLMHAHIANSLLQESTPTGQVVENLVLAMGKTMVVNSIHMDWTNLKNLDFKGLQGLETIDFRSKDLQSCVLDLSNSPDCAVNFVHQDERSLTALSLLYSRKITGSWIEQNLFQFPLLEHLKLEGCHKLEWIRCHHQKIKSLKLISCYSLTRVDIDSPMLESLEMRLNDKIPSHFAIRSNPLHVVLSLFFRNTRPVPHKDLNYLLTTFGKCKELTLEFRSDFDAMFPRKTREDATSIPPLYDLKHLRMDLRGVLREFSNILRCLLWLVPLPESITFITSKKELSIKFEYADFETGEAPPCYVYCPAKCWRHRLVGVRLSNFDSKCDDEMSKKRKLVNFIRQNSSMLVAVHDDCKASDLET